MATPPAWKHRLPEWAFDAVNVAFMCAFSFICLYPFIYVLALSLNDANDALRGGIYFFPRKFTLANYQAIFQDNQILRAYGVTVYRVVVGTLSSLAFCSMLAYALAEREFVARKFMHWWIVIPLFFSGGMIPMYITLRNLGLINNLATYVVPSIFDSFNVIVLRTFFSQLPLELKESARLDGAGEAAVFFRIYIPLSKPVLATIALFVGVGHWNDWFTATAYVADASIWPIQNLLLRIIQSNEASTIAAMSRMRAGLSVVSAESIKMAMLIVTTVPVVCIYPFLQKYFVKGITLGSLKG